MWHAMTLSVTTRDMLRLCQWQHVTCYDSVSDNTWHACPLAVQNSSSFSRSKSSSLNRDINSQKYLRGTALMSRCFVTNSRTVHRRRRHHSSSVTSSRFMCKYLANTPSITVTQRDIRSKRFYLHCYLKEGNGETKTKLKQNQWAVQNKLERNKS